MTPQEEPRPARGKIGSFSIIDLLLASQFVLLLSHVSCPPHSLSPCHSTVYHRRHRDLPVIPGTLHHSSPPLSLPSISLCTLTQNHQRDSKPTGRLPLMHHVAPLDGLDLFHPPRHPATHIPPPAPGATYKILSYLSLSLSLKRVSAGTLTVCYKIRPSVKVKTTPDIFFH